MTRTKRAGAFHPNEAMHASAEFQRVAPYRTEDATLGLRRRRRSPLLLPGFPLGSRRAHHDGVNDTGTGGG